MIGRAIFHRSPLPPNRLAALPMGAIRPDGWLLAQLEVQVRAIKAGRFGAFPAGFEDDPWLGGNGVDIMRTPAALDGLLPIAWIMRDEELKDICLRYVEWTIASQDERGNFGPEKDRDWMGRLMMLRVLRDYFTATGDRRVLVLMDRFFRYQIGALEELPLTGLAAARSAMNMEAALWLYNLTGQKHLLALCQTLRAQSLDWTNTLHVFPYIRAMTRMRPWKEMQNVLAKEKPITGADQPYAGRDYHLTQAVNVAVGLRTPGTINLFKSGFKEVSAFQTGWKKLMKHHGVAPGVFTADWHLNGASPSQGVSLQAVTELMYSLENLLAINEQIDVGQADLLEKLAYNTYPAAFSADMTKRQRLTQVNQLKASADPRVYYNAPRDANMFTDAGDDACNGGFARFISSLWYATSDDGLAAMCYAPCRVTFVAGGTQVRATVEAAYPYETTVRIRIDVKSPVEFPLYLRIPTWAEQGTIKQPDGEMMQMRAGECACVARKWTGGEVVTLEAPTAPRITNWFHGSAAVEMGALLMALRPEEQWTETDAGMTVTTDDRWNFALCEGEPMKAVLESERAGAFKSGADAARVYVKARRVPAWGMDGANAAQPPIEPAPDADAADETITLTPYGNAALHIAQFPVQKAPPKPEVKIEAGAEEDSAP